jgi:hypothetical protein
MPPQDPHRLEDSFVMDLAQSTTTKRPGAAQRLLKFIVAVLGILVGATTIAPASTTPQQRSSSRNATIPAAETRVEVAGTSSASSSPETQCSSGESAAATTGSWWVRVLPQKA